METIQHNILWSGIEYYSLENCFVESTPDGVMINSIIVGLYNEEIYRVKYDIILDKDWVTKSCIIEAWINNKVKKIDLSKQGDTWFLNGKIHHKFDNCIDVDIPLTPLTNSLPINRLRLSLGQETKVDIIYIDLLEDTIKHVKQKYKRLSTEIFKYENIPNDFEAEIKVDTAGFVVNYPQLFKRKIRVQK